MDGNPYFYTIRKRVGHLSIIYRNFQDEELLYRIAKKQEKAAFATLYDRYAHLILGVCLKYLPAEAAKEAVQSVFLKIWTSAGNYEVKKFKPWIYKVAKNHCLMELRKKNPATQNFDDLANDIVDFEDSMHLKIEEEKQLSILRECLLQLSPGQKRCLELFYMGQNTYQQISEATGFSDKEVKSHIQNGRRNLKNMFHQKWQSII